MSTVTPEPKSAAQSEREMCDAGVRTHLKRVEKKKQSGLESQTSYGIDLMGQCLDKVAAALVAWVKDLEAKPNSRKGVPAYPVLCKVDARDCAATALQVLLDRISMERPLQAVAISIGRSVIQPLIQGAVFSDNPDAEIEKLIRQRFAVGVKLLDLILANTRLVVEVGGERRGKKQDMKYLHPTPELLEWIREKNLSDARMRPELIPIEQPPKPWTGVYGGGYHTISLPLMTKVPRLDLTLLDTSKLARTFRALNAIQDTQWRINSRVLDAVRTLQRAGSCQHLFASSGAKQIQEGKVLETAKHLAGKAAIYFPHNLCFRGRIYAAPLFLNPQGSDLARGLLTFATGKPLGEEGARWLAIHGANLYGYDKATLDDRFKWAVDHTSDIQASAKDPLSCLWWAAPDVDKPWQFLAWCIEWVGYLEQGASFVSSLPVSMDGTCNGLQHLAALTRHEPLGRAVNLVKAAIPQDIYRQVADALVKRLEQEKRPEFEEMAKQWLAFGIDRKTAKPCVMVIPYGGTRTGFEDVLEAWRAKMAETRPSPFKNANKAVRYLAREMWEAAKSAPTGAANDLRDWLVGHKKKGVKGIGQTYSSKKMFARWTTPIGLPIVNRYTLFEEKAVYPTIRGTPRKLTIRVPTDEFDAKRHDQGLSPNFIHSMDASALMLTVLDCLAVGIRHFAVVHDSYGTLAADASRLSLLLRRAFVDMYQHNPVLSALRDECIAATGEVPDEVPPVGTLDLNSVLASEFFFS